MHTRCAPWGDMTSMSICWGPKVHHSSRFVPSLNVTGSLGMSGLRVLIKRRSSSVGRPAHSIALSVKTIVLYQLQELHYFSSWWQPCLQQVIHAKVVQTPREAMVLTHPLNKCFSVHSH